MTSLQRERARDLFERAVEYDDAAGAEAWLAVEAADDGEVCEEVRSLLEHHRQAGQFMSGPLALELPGEFASPLAPGAVIGAYTIVRELGRGGMGHVYLASDGILGRPVALKAVAPHLLRGTADRDRVRREARAAAALSHPAICTVHALEDIDGALYIVSEYVDGATLGQDIRSGRRPTHDEVRRTAVELASALASAHARGIVHRDLKPDNVMRTRDGRLKVLDFGLARIDRAFATEAGIVPPISVVEGVTLPGRIVGTPAYMAPEQLNGAVGDPRADVFAFGVLLYEFACGRHPFDGPTLLATMARILESDPRPLGEMGVGLSPAVTAVVARCLQKDPAARFPSAREIVAALEDQAVPAAEVRLAWWQSHQAVVMALYVVASAAAWQIKAWSESASRVGLFVAIAGVAMVGGVLRGHVVFTSVMSQAHLADERRSTRRVRLLVDGVIGALLLADAIVVVPTHALFGVFTLATGLGLVLAALVLEPATTRAVFGAGE